MTDVTAAWRRRPAGGVQRCRPCSSFFSPGGRRPIAARSALTLIRPISATPTTPGGCWLVVGPGPSACSGLSVRWRWVGRTGPPALQGDALETLPVVLAGLGEGPGRDPLIRGRSVTRPHWDLPRVTRSLDFAGAGFTYHWSTPGQPSRTIEFSRKSCCSPTETEVGTMSPAIGSAATPSATVQAAANPLVDTRNRRSKRSATP